MSTAIYYLKLIRVNNLVFILFIQCAMQFFVVEPLLITFGIEISTYLPFFLLLMTGTILIAGGGYVLNDYFDVKIDAINKPEKQIVGRILTRDTAMKLYLTLTISGTISGLLTSFLLKSYTLSFIFLATPGLLWFYSASYKRQFITGNIIVALLAAMSILLIPLAAVSSLKISYGEFLFETSIPGQLYFVTGGFAVFSFLLTWIREIVKDAEDEYGDREMECRTMPIVWGRNKTLIFILLLTLITFILLYYIQAYFISFKGNLTLRYIIFGVAIPMCVALYLLYRANIKTDFSRIATLYKYIMLAGSLYAPVFYFLLAKSTGIKFFNLLLNP